MSASVELFAAAVDMGLDLQNILQQSYDNAKVTVDLRQTSNLQNILRRVQVFSYGTIHLQSCKIVWDSVLKLAYNIPKRNFSTFKSLS